MRIDDYNDAKGDSDTKAKEKNGCVIKNELVHRD